MTANKMSGFGSTHFTGNKGNILIIDGDREDRVFFRRLLQSAYSVVTAADSEAAMKNIERYAGFLSLIIVSLDLGETEGIRLLRKLKTDNRFCNIPVVALGSFDSDGAEALQTGAADYLRKPFEAPELIRIRIDNAVSSCVMPEADMTEEHMDSLTGLMTMPRFTDMVEAIRSGNLLNRSVQECFVFFDISKFKLYNILKGRDSGDRMLAEIGRILREVYGGEHIVRKSDDHFVVIDYDTGSVVKRVMEVCSSVADLDPDFRLQIRAGIYYSNSDEPISEACDKAKLAGDSIRDNLVMPYCVYTDELNREAELRKYLVDNLDRAIEEGWIHIYYQPVVRTLTGELCGLEALTRWKDPERGMLAPATFIPALEESNIIYKLDTYVIREVARNLREQIDRNIPVVPVSFNISRMDFDRNDPYEVVERITQYYKIPTELLRIEITESAVMDDEEKIHAEMNKFQQHNYEVWMDDFGSGYSSLNVLKDFYFDEIKIDMLFLNNLNERSRQIITSIVDMAKKMGIRTLAEGVETREQIKFLCDIGCEKLQGFYYGRPMPYDELMMHCRNIGIEPEDLLAGKFYDKVGNVNVITDNPLALVKYDERRMEFVYANESFRSVLKSVGVDDLGRSESELNTALMGQSQKLHGLTEKAARTGKPEIATLVVGGNYLRVVSEHIGKLGNIHMYKVSADNITIGTQLKDASSYDRMLRNVIMVYDEIYFADLKEDFCETIISSRYEFKQGYRLSGLARLVKCYSDNYIYYMDREQFRKFTRRQHKRFMRRRNSLSPYAESFRLRWDDGSYRWHEFNVLGIPENPDQMLICVKLSALEYSDDRNRATEYYLKESKVAAPVSMPLAMHWNSLMEQSDIKFFWKDKNHRYMGASKSFRDSCGVEIHELFGKTDEELGWAPESGEDSRCYEAVMGRGERVLNAPGRIVINGEEKSVLNTLLPVYENGVIEGLIGYIQDSDTLTEAADESRRNQMIDPVTGLYNIWGINIAISNAEEEFRNKRVGEYSITLLDLPEYDSLREKYGHELCMDLVRSLAEKLGNAVPRDATAARLHGSLFMIVDFEEDKRKHEKDIYAMMRAMRMVDHIGDDDVVIRVDYGTSYASECSGVQEMLERSFGQIVDPGVSSLGEVVFDRNNAILTASSFESSNELVLINDPDDYSLLYLNKRARRELGLEPDADISSMKCYQVLHGSDTPCDFCMCDRLRRNCFFTRTGYNPVIGRDFLKRNTLIPWNGKNCRLLISIPLEEVVDSGSSIKRRILGTQAINDSVGASLNADSPKNGLHVLMQQLLDRTLADKVYIFEEDGTGYVKRIFNEMSDGTSPELLPNRFSKSGLKPLYQLLEKDRTVIVEDRDRARGLQEEARTRMEDVGIRSIAVAQLFNDGKSRGFIAIENFDSQTIDITTSDMRLLGEYVSTALRNLDNSERIKDMGRVDDLTGVRNMEAFSEIMDDDSQDRDFSLFYVDLNDLNSINKSFGRKAGDRLLGKTAEILTEIFDRRSVFRIGGDEFVAFADLRDNEQIDEISNRLRRKLEEQEVSAAVGCVRKGSGRMTIGELMREADRRMYLDKRFNQKPSFYM